MKKNFILLTIAIFAGTIYTSCNKITALINAAIIPWSGVDMSFTVPVITDTTLTTSLGSGSCTYNLDSFIRSQTANQFGLANLDTFTLSTCTLTIQNPDADNNFANLKSAQGNFYTSTNTNTNMASLGSIDNNPDVYAITLPLPVNNTSNLKNYVSSSGTTTFTYSLSAKARRVTTKELNVSAHVTFHIHVTP